MTPGFILVAALVVIIALMLAVVVWNINKDTWR